MVKTSNRLATEALNEIWQMTGCDASALDNIKLTGEDPVLSSIFRVGTAASATIGAASLAAAEIWRLRTGNRQELSLNCRDAAIAFCSENYTRVVGNRALNSGHQFLDITRQGIIDGSSCIASSRIYVRVS